MAGTVEQVTILLHYFIPVGRDATVNNHFLRFFGYFSPMSRWLKPLVTVFTMIIMKRCFPLKSLHDHLSH